MQYPSQPKRSGPSAPLFDGTQACAGRDLELFFPATGGSARTRAAKRLCASCRFLEPCREYAITAQGVPGVYVDGVWGGTTRLERLEIRRSRGLLRPLRAVAA